MESGIKNIYDLRRTEKYDFTAIETFFNLNEVKKELGVPLSRKWTHCNRKVHYFLANDIVLNQVKNVKYILEKRLPILIYSGDLDIICNWLGGNEWTYNLDWSGKK